MNKLMKREEQVMFALRELYRQYGYSQFKMSKFEPYELYMQNKDFLVSSGIITFTDTDGTLMALKPDVTLSIVRNFQPAAPMQKVHYSENVYRMSAGHSYREIMQTGLECMGSVSLYEICEVITLAAKSLQTISHRFVLDISHMQIITSILDSLSLSPSQQAQILQAIADKNEDALIAMDADTSLLIKLLQAGGPIGTAKDAIRPLCSTPSGQAAWEQLDTICAIVHSLGLDEQVHLDFSIVHNMNYYNGIVFRGYAEGIPCSILSGGQYDKLMEKMQKKAGGIGFAVYLDQLERLDPERPDFDADCLILYQQQDDPVLLHRAASQLIRSGQRVLLLKNKPAHIRCRNIYSFENGGLILLEEHG